MIDRRVGARDTRSARRLERVLALALAAAGSSGTVPTASATPREADLQAHVVRCVALPAVRAASALVRQGDRLLVAQDAYADLAVLDAKTYAVRNDPRAGGVLDKATKPDWEAAFTGRDGSVYVVGSGAAAPRRRIDHLAVDGTRRTLRVESLYASIERSLGTPPNLEGAVRLGGAVRLFHRGSGQGRSATIDVPLAALVGGRAAHAPPRFHDLGRSGRVPLHFTDAAVRGGRVVFLAAAEDTPDAIADGAVVGAAAGVLDDEGVRTTPVREADGRPSVRKFEGLLVDGKDAWAVTDPDDDAVPSELCRLDLRGPW